jgi:acyl-CoA reductase-like NAD-dependent aldehyde dehydrogenase
MDFAPPALAAAPPTTAAPVVEKPPLASLADLDRAVAEVGDRALAFARTPPREKAALLRSTLPALLTLAPEMAALSCRAEGIEPASPRAGEAWRAGPVAVITNARLLAEALDDIASAGRPALPIQHIHKRRDGRVVARLEPRGWADGLASDVTAEVLFAEGSQPEDVIAGQASFYRQREPEGSVQAILGGEGAPGLAPMDALHALFVEGRVAVLSMSSRHAALGPVIERALGPLVERGFLRVVHGGAEAAAHLAQHAGVGSVRFRGTMHDHDELVWGAPGPERDRRRAEGDPLLQKPLSSELGGLGPMIVVPCLYATDELWFLARSVASQVAIGGGAPRALVLPAGWPQRAIFSEMLERAFSQIPRPWTFASVDPGEAPFTGVLRDGVLLFMDVGSDDPPAFLAAATALCNEELPGTLSAQIVVHPIHEEDPEIGAALEQAVTRLRYGTVGINAWPALASAMAAPPWGGHPSATLAAPGSGLGFSHNTRMLSGVDKTIVRGPLRSPLAPAYFCDNHRARAIGERMAAFAARPGVAPLLGAFRAALRG